MTYTNTPTAVSIFTKGKSSAQVSSLVHNGSGNASLQQFIDPNDALDHQTQDEDNESSTQSSNGDGSNKPHPEDSSPAKPNTIKKNSQARKIRPLKLI
jgi:hypothetical protein